jgi:hypothetical protein
MDLPERRIRVVAATPIEVGDQRLLPSVLVNTVSRRWLGRGLFHLVRLRPVSIVVEGSEEASWLEIPNATADALSSMAAAATGIAVVAIFLLSLIRFLRRV